MVGNVDEWVADWADRANGCTDWTSQTSIAGGDFGCFGGNGSGASNQIPGALVRGGLFGDGTVAGVFSVDASFVPSFSFNVITFWCA
jgi:formylglycine-generating enzyme required for sulfatase activity